MEHRFRGITAVLAAALAVGAWSPRAVANSALRPSERRFAIDLDDTQDCVEAIPSNYDASLGGPRWTARLLLIVDGVDPLVAEAVVRDVTEAYRLLRIDLISRQIHASFPSDGRRQASGGPRSTLHAEAAVDYAKKMVGGRRPTGVDVVYTLTNKDLWAGDPSASDENRKYGIAGEADCIGGVRYDDRAFAVGEVDDDVVQAGITFGPQFSSVVAAHEIGHLFGAQHHFAVCGPTAASAGRRRTDVCTTMFPEATLPSLTFSPVNSAIIRGHARDHLTHDFSQGATIASRTHLRRGKGGGLGVQRQRQDREHLTK